MTIAAKSAISQVPDFSKVPNLWDLDSLNITNLVNHGTKISRQKAVCWFPKDSLAEQRMNEIADTINKGIIAAEKFIHAPLPWQVHSFEEPYIYYFRTDSFISHASGAGFVSVPFWRIKNSRAPWLHEAMHEMLNTNKGDWQDSTRVPANAWKNDMPLWLFEGLPDYISLEVSRLNHLQWYDVFSRGSKTNVDSMFVADIKGRNDTATYILSHIGEKGAMPELFSNERALYAPAFYHGSCSFVKYLVANYGIDVLLSAISSFQHEGEIIEELSSKPLATLKREWEQKLGMKN